MNIGIIGFGNIAKSFFKSLEFIQGVKVSAIGSKSLIKDNEFHNKHPEINVYPTYAEVLSDPNIDGIYIALPHSLHKEWSLKALDLKIPVFCEKPATLFLNDMKEITNLSKEKNVLFLEAFKIKFNHGFNQLKKDILLIGDINRVSTSFCFDATIDKESRPYLFEIGQGGAINDIGTDMVLEIQEFINLVESSQNESKIHSLKDTELIIRTLEQIRVGK